MIHRSAFAVGATLLACAAAAADLNPPAVSPAAETAHIRKLIESPDLETRRRGCKMLKMSGITSPELFDYVAKAIEARYLRAGDDARHVKEVAALVEALATSGDPKRAALLEKVADADEEDVDRRLRRVAAKAIKLLERYQAWNPVIDKPAPKHHKLFWQVRRVVNMTESGDYDLQRGGVDRALELRDSHPEVFDALSAQLASLVVDGDVGARDQDLAVLLVGALGRSGQAKYRPQIEQIADHTRSRKLGARADDALRRLEQWVPEDEADDRPD